MTIANDKLSVLGTDYKTKALALREVADNAEVNSRTERQRLIDTILTFYNSDDMQGKGNPALLIDVEEAKFDAKCAKELARRVYNLPLEGTIERRYEKAIRDVANIVHFAIEKRIPFQFSEEQDALLVPSVLVTTSKDIRKDLLEGKLPYEEAIANPSLGQLVPLNGEDSKNLATLRKNIPNYLKKAGSEPESEDALTLALHKVGSVMQKLPVGYLPEAEAIEMAEEIVIQLKAMIKPAKKSRSK